MGSKRVFGDFYPAIKVTRRRQNQLTTRSFFDKDRTTNPNLSVYVIRQSLPCMTAEERCLSPETGQRAIGDRALQLDKNGV